MSLGGVTNNLVPAVLDATKQSSLTVPSYVDANQSNAVGGKGGVGNTMVPVQQTYAAPNVYYAGAAPAQVGSFDNSGRIVDPTLLAQQAMLNRAPVSYQPLLTPDNYQNFYQAPTAATGGKGGGNLVVPDYRPQATLFRDDFAKQQAAAAANSSGGNSYIYYAPTENTTTWGWDSPGAGGVSTYGNPSAGTVLGETVGAGLNALGLNTQDPSNATVSDMGPTSSLDPSSYGYTNAMDAQSDAAAAAAADAQAAADAAMAEAAAQANAENAAAGYGEGGGGGGDGKIICTAMNHAYGFGSFRNAIWIAYADKHLTKAHEVGYHTLFLPLVDFGFKRGNGRMNMAVRKVLEWGTRHRSTDLRAEMRGTKRDTTGRIIRFVFEPLCYAVGKLKGY